MFNQYNPYIPNYNSFIPQTGAKGGLSGLLSNFGRGSANGLGLAKKGINWSSLLTNTQKTLGVINQTIPTINQIKPIVNNAKTMFRLMGEMKKIEKPSPSNPSINTNNKPTQTETNNPKFFI